MEDKLDQLKLLTVFLITFNLIHCKTLNQTVIIEQKIAIFLITFKIRKRV